MPKTTKKKPAAEPTGAGGWLTYRPDLKVLDCTIRDGGLINAHKFSDDFVRVIHAAALAAGVDYFECGYKSSKRLAKCADYGPWKFCDEADLRRVFGDEPDQKMKLCVMADAERTDFHADILPRSESILSMVRVACYIHQMPTAVEMIRDAHDKGYETTCNIMALSTIQEPELRAALKLLATTPVDTVYVVDSFGSLYSEQVRDYIRLFLAGLGNAGKQIGIHTHNNQQLAFSNSIEAVIHGVTMVDATIYGLGRGAGNCPMELLLGFLKNPKFEQRPLIECIQQHLLPLSKQIDWGYSIPYMISGQLNRHPREAMELREGPKKESLLEFYDKMME
ncbi:MAG: aldolase catalytic domain-containing protein [bacterium]